MHILYFAMVVDVRLYSRVIPVTVFFRSLILYRYVDYHHALCLETHSLCRCCGSFVIARRFTGRLKHVYFFIHSLYLRFPNAYQIRRVARSNNHA